MPAVTVLHGCTRHIDCRQFNGPFEIVDADTGNPLRASKFHRVRDAFRWADGYVGCSTGDFRVTDRLGHVITRREAEWSWLRR